MKNRIAVLGGSFNPPTIAHRRLLEAAVDAVDAGCGMFLPSAYWYVERKLKKQGRRQDALSDRLRLDMLKSMCETDGRLMVSALEINRAKTERGYNYEGLLALQRQYPESEIYFVAGSDKLHVIPRWHRIEEFVEHFKILVASREEDDLEEIKRRAPFLKGHWDAFEVFSVPEEIGHISSSSFREMLRQNDPAAQMLVTDGVWNILNEAGKIPWNTIGCFREEYFYLSNFYETQVTYGGFTYGSGEAAFQAQKCMTEEEKLPFTEAAPS